MNLWSKCKLGNLIEIILGGTPKTTVDEFWVDGTIPWVSVVDFSDSKFIRYTQKNITDLGIQFSNTKLLDVGDIILSARGTVGKLAVCSCQMAFNQSCYALRTKTEKILDQDFLFYLMSDKVMEMRQKAVGGVFDAIIKSTIENIETALPPLHTQKRIASILSAYDDLIEVNRLRIKLLEEASDLIYKEWFVNFRFPGHESIRFADGIPEGWEESSIFDFALIESGGTPKTTIREYWDGHIPFFTPTDYEERYVIYKTVRNLTDEGLSRCNSKLYPQNSVFITARGTVGKAMMNLSPMAINQSCYALNSINFSSNYFLFFTLRYLYAKVKKMAIGGVFDTIIVDTFKNLIFFRPEAELIIEFEELVKPFFDEMAVLVITIDKLKEARDLLLPKLMSGEIEV